MGGLAGLAAGGLFSVYNTINRISSTYDIKKDDVIKLYNMYKLKKTGEAKK